MFPGSKRPDVFRSEFHEDIGGAYNMNVNHLKSFFEVAKAKGFTHAAKQLNVSQPTLSAVIGRLPYPEHRIRLHVSSEAAVHIEGRYGRTGQPRGTGELPDHSA